MSISRRLPQLRKSGFKKRGKKCYFGKPLFLLGKKYFSFGKGITIYKGARIECYSSYADEKLYPNLVIGDFTIIGYNFQCLVTTNCFIGNNCMIASNVLISTENHGMNPEQNYLDQPLVSKEIIIGDNVWLGERVIILPGVQIGNNAIIGAGSVVTKSIPSNCIAVGNPAKIIKKYNFETKEWENEIR